METAKIAVDSCYVLRQFLTPLPLIDFREFRGLVPLMTYCDMVTLNLPESWLSKFVNLENRAKKIIANGLSIENDDLNIRDFYSTRIFNAVIVVFKSLNGLSCEPFNDYFQIMSHQQNTRNND